MDLIYQYSTHKGKAMKITAFYQTQGWIFNFIAVQDQGNDIVKFDEKSNNHHMAYQSYL